ncbi:LOW QUALITY PROTEIN: VN1R1 isoform 1 [Pongo abelii]|uniref:Vomeronasal type-1 receptor n=1 Tax=Pongo abelii TaxID=9601 RepID=A0A2J8RQ37_PONAB|nr:LOW QUALITY PROTEIN: VN1R1 isoform 1 [Pongo abelii]
MVGDTLKLLSPLMTRYFFLLFYSTDSSDLNENQHLLDFDEMAFGKVKSGISFLIQTGVGILGNSFLLCFYNLILFTGHKLRPMDLILSQLALANSMVLFFKGIPQTMAAFGLKYFLNDTGCKFVFYYHRVGTGVSLSTICLLNGFQAIKLNPSIFRWMEIKIRSPRFIGFCSLFCWVLHVLMNASVLLLVNGPLNSKNSSAKDYGYCSYKASKIFSSLYTVLYFSHFMSLGFMVWASGSMVFFLQHKRQVQHIHSNRLSCRPFREARATRTIMVLVSSLFVFYSVHSFLTIWTTVVANPGQWMVNNSVSASCFPALSPFVLIMSDTRISQFCFAGRTRKTLFPNLVVMP